MKARRIHIMGASGSGTTTLGQALSSRLACAHFDADDYFWLPTQPPYRQKRAREARLPLILADLEKADGYVVSGSICGWGEELESDFDLVIFLFVPTEIRIRRLVDRETRKFGHVDREFIEWARRYDGGDLDMRSRALHESWLSQLSCPVLRIEGDRPVDDSLAAILQKMDYPDTEPRREPPAHER